MVASLNYQNDLSQSEQQIEVGSHVESRISFGRMRNILPEGNFTVILNMLVSSNTYTCVSFRLDYITNFLVFYPLVAINK